MKLMQPSLVQYPLEQDKQEYRQDEPRAVEQPPGAEYYRRHNDEADG